MLWLRLHQPDVAACRRHFESMMVPGQGHVTGTKVLHCLEARPGAEMVARWCQGQPMQIENGTKLQHHLGNFALKCGVGVQRALPAAW